MVDPCPIYKCPGILLNIGDSNFICTDCGREYRELSDYELKSEVREW